MIQSTGGFIFGGFADKQWTSSGFYCKSDKAFLFSLKIPSPKIGPTKIRVNQNKCYYAMKPHSSYGPSFGGGNDITNDANNNSYSSSILRENYEIPPGQTNTFLVGSKNFKVSEIEVSLSLVLVTVTR